MMRRQRGMALLMVLLMMSLMAAAAVDISGYWQRALDRTQSQQERLQAKWLLLGAESYARQRFLQEKDRRNQWTPAGLTMDMRTEQGDVAIRIRRVDPCYNVNALIRAAAAGHGTLDTLSREREIFMLLLKNTGVDEAQAGAIADGIANRSRKTGYLMADISELRELKGIDRERYQRLAPQLCVFPDAELRINPDSVNESRLPLLRAMLMNSVTRERLHQLFMQRPQQGWQSLAFLSGEGEQSLPDDDNPGARLIFDDNRWIAELQLTLNDRRYRLTRAWLLGQSEMVAGQLQFGAGGR